MNSVGHLPGFGTVFFAPVSTKKRLSSGLSAIRPLQMDRKRKKSQNDCVD